MRRLPGKTSPGHDSRIGMCSFFATPEAEVKLAALRQNVQRGVPDLTLDTILGRRDPDTAAVAGICARSRSVLASASVSLEIPFARTPLELSFSAGVWLGRNRPPGPTT